MCMLRLFLPGNTFSNVSGVSPFDCVVFSLDGHNRVGTAGYKSEMDREFILTI